MKSSRSLGPSTRLRSVVSGPLTSCCSASVALIEHSPHRPVQLTAPTRMALPRGRGNHRSTRTTSCRRPGHAGRAEARPEGWSGTHLPGLYRSNYPAPHAEACCDPDRGRVRPVPLVRRGRPHRDLRRHRPRHRADRLPARLPRPADRQQHHHRRRGAGRRRAAAPLRRQPDRQQPGQADQRRRLPPAGPDRPERHGARGRREGAAGRPGGHPAHHRRRRHQHGGGRPGGLPRDPGLRAHGRRPPQDHRQRHRADPAEPRRADRGRSRPPGSPRTSSPSTAPTLGCSSSTR